MPKKTMSFDVDENLLVVANNEISELLCEYDNELISADEEGDIEISKKKETH